MRVVATSIAVAASLFVSQAFAQMPESPVEEAAVEARAAASVPALDEVAAVDTVVKVVKVVAGTTTLETTPETTPATASVVKRDERERNPIKDDRGSSTPKSNARIAAVGDSVSTLLAVSAGAAELNPLITPTPGGLLLVAALKFGLVEVVDALPEEQRHTTHRSLSAMWGAASVSNLLIATSVAPPVAAVVGIAAGWWLWQQHRAPTNAGDGSVTTARASEDKIVEAKAAFDR